MIREMCSFVDAYAEHVLGEKFEPNWPKNPEYLNRVYITNILDAISSKKSDEKITFIVYKPETQEITILSKYEVLDKMNEELRDLISPIINNSYICSNFYDEPNKRLGSTRGVGSFLPFIFRVDLNISKKKIKEKFEATEKSLSRYDGQEFIHILNDDAFLDKILGVLESLKERHSLKKELKDSKQEKEEALKETKKKLETLNNIYVLILYNNVDPYKKFLSSKELLRNAITIKRDKQRCQICDNEDETGYPVVGNSYDQKKEFLVSPTKGDGRISICSVCGFKVNAFYKMLKASKNILPVFIDEQATVIEAKNIMLYLKGQENYSQFMDRIYENLGEDEFKMAHYLMLNTGDFIWVDYVSSLKWKLEWLSINESMEIKRELKNRKEIENVFYASIIEGTAKREAYLSIYFGDLKDRRENMREIEGYLLYRFREQLYRFVYKNENSFSMNDILEFVNLAVAQKYHDVIRNKWKISTFDKSIIAPLEIFFNAKNIAPAEGKNMKELNELRKVFEEVIKENRTQELSDEEWAYCAGAFYRYLIGLSKAKEPRLELEPFINAGRISDVLEVLTRTFERYQHEIKQPYLSKWGAISASSFVPKNKDKGFEELRPYFYAGFVDPFASNMFYSKKEE